MDYEVCHGANAAPPTYVSYASAEAALHFCPPGKRYRLSNLGLPVTV